MADGGGSYSLRTVSAIADIDKERWTQFCAATDSSHPFISYDFLQALEQSKSVYREAGWLPCHLLLEENGTPVGAAPVYLKGHSQGEFVFDHHWADAFERAGGRYYPKLLCAIPFTPAGGPRLLAEHPAQKQALASALAQLCQEFSASSAHINFVTDHDATALQASGYLARQGIQYHWFNRDYQCYDDFLATLSSRKRKAIKKERRQAHESGLTIERRLGTELTEDDWDHFWIFYQDTGARKWGSPYLTRTFFRLVAKSMGEQIMMAMAYDDGTPVAGALNFIGGDTLYGRYWGCTQHHRFLHFELCYHQAIEFAIERGLGCVEAGAQGEHKIARGYEPVVTHSYHWIENPSFRDAIARYLDAETKQEEAEINYLKNFTPFKRGDS